MSTHITVRFDGPEAKSHLIALMMSWYSENLSFRTAISTGSTGGGTLIRSSLDLATGSSRDFLPRTGSTSTAALGARSLAAGALLPTINLNMAASKCSKIRVC